MILSNLDHLVATGRLTGYTVEEDIGYLESRVPTLTYRMYVDGEASHLNLGAFAAAMAELGAVMRLSRVRGNLGEAGMIRRSKQLCLTAEFDSTRTLDHAVDIVHGRFIAAPAAAPGSWRYPDVRVAGAEPMRMSPAFAHRWKADRAAAVALTLESEPPAPGAQTVQLRVLTNWMNFLQGSVELECGETEVPCKFIGPRWPGACGTEAGVAGPGASSSRTDRCAPPRATRSLAPAIRAATYAADLSLATLAAAGR